MHHYRLRKQSTWVAADWEVKAISQTPPWILTHSSLKVFIYNTRRVTQTLEDITRAFILLVQQLILRFRPRWVTVVLVGSQGDYFFPLSNKLKILCGDSEEELITHSAACSLYTNTLQKQSIVSNTNTVPGLRWCVQVPALIILTKNKMGKILQAEKK